MKTIAAGNAAGQGAALPGRITAGQQARHLIAVASPRSTLVAGSSMSPFIPFLTLPLWPSAILGGGVSAWANGVEA